MQEFAPVSVETGPKTVAGEIQFGNINILFVMQKRFLLFVGRV